jgi:hypothetical protein
MQIFNDMKTKLFFLISISFIFISCNKWDEYYFGTGNNEEELSMSVTEFMESHAEYSDFYNMLKTTGLDAELNRDQEITLWVVNNEGMQQSSVVAGDTLRMKYHINNLPFIRSDLKNGKRIRSLNGIYFQITQRNDTIFTNSSWVIKSYRLNNGVVHEISRLMKSRINMYDYLKQLGNEYSIIRDSVFKYDKRLFDRANSTPIGVDKTGNTIYDSIFYVHNPIFDKAQFNSEFSQFTCFLPSNAVINECFTAMNDQYRKMGKIVAKADSALALTWIKESMFYNGIITDFSQTDIKSAYNRVWRTTVQQLDRINFEEMSNGRIYLMNKVKIPNNVIISRIKSLVHYWEYQEKLYPDTADLYKFKGLTVSSSNPTIFVGDATPVTSILPNYVLLQLTGVTDSENEFSVEFPPLEKYFSTEDAKNKVRVMQVPAGEYNLYMGFRASAHPYVNIYFNGTKVNLNPIQASLSTPWNYDRVNETSKDLDPVNGVTKWDGLGGLVGPVTVDGEGMASFKIKVEFVKLNDAGAQKKMQIYHWTLKPTANNY